MVDADAEQIPFSIASTPQDLPHIELHYQAIPGLDQSQRVDRLLTTKSLQVTQAQGNCWLDATKLSPINDEPQTLVLIAASSGMSQAHCIAEHCAQVKAPPHTHLFWGARAADQLYLHQAWERRERSRPWLSYYPCVSEHDAAWRGNVGTVGALAGKLLGPLLATSTVIICGGPPAVYGILDELVPFGARMGENVHSDVFDYAPRGADA